MRWKKLKLPKGRYALACLICVALMVGLVLPTAEAQSMNMRDGNGQFDANANMVAVINVNGVPSQGCSEPCPIKSVSVGINPTSGLYAVTPNDGTHTGGSGTQSGSTYSPDTTGTPSPVADHATDPNGNMSGTSNGLATVQSSIAAAKQAYLDLGIALGLEPSVYNGWINGVSGSYDVVVTWKTECEPAGDCTYTATITVSVDNNGNPTNATATGS